MDIKMVNSYPECLKEYFYMLVRPVIATWFIILVKFTLNKTLKIIMKTKLLMLKARLGNGEDCINK